MRKDISIILGKTDRQRLEALVADRNASQKHVWRARIVLLSVRGVGTNAIMAATGTAKTTVWRWQARFMEEGVAGLLRDKTRPPGKPPVADDRAAAIVAMTLKPPPHEATHWTARAMAKAAGLAVSTVQKIWKAHGLAPHRWRAFKLSNDPAFAQKLHDVVGLYVAPPAHAVVLSIDEKSQIQALDRTADDEIRLVSAGEGVRACAEFGNETDGPGNRQCASNGIVLQVVPARDRRLVQEVVAEVFASKQIIRL